VLVPLIVVIIAVVIFGAILNAKAKSDSHANLNVEWEPASSDSRTEDEILTDELSLLCDDLKEYIVEIPIAVEASKGRAFSPDAIRLLLDDLKRILAAFATANGGITYDMRCFFHRAWRKLLHYDGDDVKPSDLGLSAESDGTFPLPLTIQFLSAFDNQHGTQHTVRLAKFFLRVVSTPSVIGYSEFIAARQYVQKRYLALIEPYANNSNSNSNRSCTKCARFYAILRLEPDASKDEIETARKNLTQIYHPDRFAGSNNEGLRRTAEEETKKVNEAYVHVMEHFAQN
jgi:hypothetical protein